MPIVIVKCEHEMKWLMSNDSRANMVSTAAALIGTRGVSATSFSDVITASGAPRGSIYHHFPEGKKQLAIEAVRWTSARVLAHQRTCPTTTPAAVLNWFVAMWRNVVVTSHGTAGCVVAGVAVDSQEGEDGLISIVGATFTAWTDLLTEQLRAAGLPVDRCHPVALTTLAAMEGALILCRAEGGPGPLDTVAEELLRLLPVD